MPYLWDLSASGWANAFYSAAVQAASKSWKAFFFGSSDSSNFITVDKPPASLWVMDISARLFGVNAWSILVPQALEGVACVGLVYAAVRRWFGAGAGLLAGTVLALTPVAALMFRYNNPDALLVLLLTAAAYSLIRALEDGRTRWLVLAGTLVGTAFLAKLLQAFLVVPAFALVYLVAAPPALWTRVKHLAWAGVALLVAAGWWVLAVVLTPAADRPYIGGSTDNSLLNMIFSYNGFGRLTGNEPGSVGGGTGGSRWGVTGLLRLFNADMGGQISWLLPSALALFVVGLWSRRGLPRTDRVRAALLLWGGWLLVTGVVFSEAHGIIHPYYTVALAPAIAALVGSGSVLLWRARSQARWVATGGLACAVAAGAVWSYLLLRRTPSWHPQLRWAVLIVGLLAAAGLLLATLPAARRWAVPAAVAAVIAGLAGPAAYAAQTVTTPHSGALPSAGPSSGVGGFGGPGGARSGAFPGRGGGSGSLHGFPGGGFPGSGSSGAGSSGFSPPSGTAGGGVAGGGFAGGGFSGGGVRGGGIGGLLGASTPGRALVRLLESDASHYRWVAATVGSNNAAGYQLATDDPVMAIGGFNGTDPAPTLAAFQADVRAGRIHYFIAGGTWAGSGTDAARITAWVEAHYRATTVDGTTVYDLTADS